MTIKTKTTIKSYFEEDDKPTQGQFANLIDSFTHINTDYAKLASTVTARTLTQDDAGKTLIFANTSAGIVTLPEQTTELIQEGSRFFIRRGGTGALSFDKDAGGVILSASGATTIGIQYGEAQVDLQSVSGNNVWFVRSSDLT